MPAPTKVVANVWSVGKTPKLHRAWVAKSKNQELYWIFCSGTTIRHGETQTHSRKAPWAESAGGCRPPANCFNPISLCLSVSCSRALVLTLTLCFSVPMRPTNSQFAVTRQARTPMIFKIARRRMAIHRFLRTDRPLCGPEKRADWRAGHRHAKHRLPRPPGALSLVRIFSSHCAASEILRLLRLARCDVFRRIG